MPKLGHSRGRRGESRAPTFVKLLFTLVIVVSLSSSLSLPTAVAACPNGPLRTGPSAQLPDCRAYELVTSPESNGRRFGDVGTEFYPPADLFANEMTSRFGDSVVFETKASALSSPRGGNGRNDGDIYQSVRSTSGWRVVRHVTPTGAEVVAPYTGAVSFDHKYNFVFVPHPGLDGGRNGTLGQEGEADYLGDPHGNFELTGIGSLGVERLAQGRYISPGGEHVIFSTGRTLEESGWCESAEIPAGHPPPPRCPVKRLEPEAPPSGTGAVYDRSADGPTHVVSLLPGDVTPAPSEDALYQGASLDGATVAFKIEGTLYVRIDNEKTEGVAAGNPTYGGLSEDGGFLFYESAGNIHRFNTVSEADEQINASGDAKMVNASADGSHVYFISPSQLDGSEGTVGEPNLYVWSGGSPEYIATVDQSDTEGIPALTNWTSYAVAPINTSGLGPGADSSRTTPDGSVLVFESVAQLTSYDNAGHTAIYRYDDEDKSLVCVSCNPMATSAAADARLEDLGMLFRTTIIQNLSADGGRIFFETREPLVKADVDGVNDIYEWQETGGEGVPVLNLISPGTSVEYPQLIPEISPRPNVLVGVSPEGGDVFFISQDALAPGAGVGGASAIYDARIGGGFVEAPGPQVCLDEACRPPPSPPPLLGAGASIDLHGSGNVVPAKKKHRRCRRRSGRHKHCAKARARRVARMATSSGLAGDNEAVPGVAPPVSAREPLATPPGATAAALLSGAEDDARREFEEEFGIESVGAEASTTAAAQHPDFSTSIALKPPKTEAGARVEDLAFELPPGLYGNPNLVPRCSTGDFVGGECPVDSQVGVVRIRLYKFPGVGTFPLFNLEPVHPAEELARFGVKPLFPAVFIDVSVRTDGDYGVTGTAHGVPGAALLVDSEAIFWGNPADPSHDEERMTIQEGNCGTPCEAPGGKRSTEELGPIAFMTNPSACGPLQITADVTSYQLPGQVFSKSAPMDPITDCQGLPFAPTFEAHPTSHVAGAPTGLQISFHLPQISDPSVPSTATMREARITLPEGMAINTSAADGLAACSEAEVHFHEEVVAQCPDAAKLGAAILSAPALPRALKGALYLRSQGEAGHRFRLWLVSDDLGLHVKIPAEIKADPATGRLTAVFSNLPQVPVEGIDLDVWGGPRAPLKNPDACGTYQTSFSFQPHSNDPAVTGTTPMAIDEGCAARGFSPLLHGGATRPKAGAFSPFVLDLTRADTEQDLAGLEVTLPKGLLAKLKGVELCPEEAAPAGACPDASKVGQVIAAAGAGPFPLWLPQPGKSPTAVYLAGPYKSAPYSIVSVVPAQAGPFDLGNVVVRSALEIDPETGIATVKADPLPQFVEGVPVLYRRLHVAVDRPKFMLNPTDCSPMQITSTLTSTEGTVAHPSERFQVDGCKALGFKPKLAIELKGGTKRGEYPALSATLKARRGDANLGAVSVALPHSEFLAQEHIITICTRKQFAAHNCPKGSVYGHAKAWTPLLSKTLSGPVYLRSSSHLLPDLVIDLKGQIEIAVDGRIDQVHRGIRTNFEAVPDAPISRFVLEMRGGKKSLLLNSTDLCAGRHRATVRMRAQNGRRVDARPALGVACR
jgi:hypothetical protein